jgi:predicted metal-dependent peptidase
MSDYPVESDLLRFKLMKQFPYFGTAIYRMKPVKHPYVEGGMNTFAVDASWRWHYADKVPFTPEEQVTVLYHELSHLLRNHSGRIQERHPLVWNLAADCEINDWFPDGMDVPQNLIFPKKFGLPDGNLAEWYYNGIPTQDVHTREDATPLTPGTGKCTTPGCDSKDVLIDRAELSPDGTVITEPAKGKIHTPVCGGLSKGEGGEEVSGGVSEVEAEAIRREVAERIEEAKARGNIPSGLERWAKELLHPQIPWNKLLRTVARREGIIIAGDTEQTWHKPSRRQPTDLIMPRRYARKCIPAFYVDTSGSIGEEELVLALTEVRAAVKNEAGLTYVTPVDAEVYKTQKLTSVGQVRGIKLQGGGGTDMRLCFPHAETLRPKPNLLIIITDGYTPWPDVPPKMRTIVVLTTQEDGPAWAKNIHLDREGADR